MSSKQTIELKTTPIDKVIVFSDRAEIRRNVAVKLEKGINEILITNLPVGTYNDSVRISGTGNAVIHEVQVNRKEATKEEIDCPQATTLREQLKAVKDEGEVLENRRNIIEKQRGALDGILAKLGSTDRAQNLQFDDQAFTGINNLFKYYETQVLQLRDAEKLVKADEEKIKEKKKVLQAELDKFGRSGSNKTVTVILESKKASSISICLGYQVNGAGWTPSYDIRVDKGNENHMNITYSGSITQKSGEDWSGCQLVLSTAKPSRYSTIPTLNTLDVEFQMEYKGLAVMSARRSCPATGGLKRRLGRDSSDDDSDMGAGSRSRSRSRSRSSSRSLDRQTAEVQEQALSTEFVITRPAAIPPDGAEHKVTIGAASFIPQLQHECVPSKNNNVFLIGSTINSSPLPFLPGEAAIFLDGNFITKSQLKAVSPGEHFYVSLGVDASIKVDYKPCFNKQGETGMVSKSRTTIKEQLVIVRNTKNEPVLVTIKEQIPRSTEDKIKVTLLSPEANFEKVDEHLIRSEGAFINEITNNLEWTVNIPSQGKRELKIKYQIDYPLKKKIRFVQKWS